MSSFNIFEKNFELVRKSPGSYVDGIWQDGIEITTVIRGDYQPTLGNDMLSLPDGRRVDDGGVLYTETELLEVRDGVNPDIIIIGGVRHEVVHVEKWDWDLYHYKATLKKCEQEL